MNKLLKTTGFTLLFISLLYFIPTTILKAAVYYVSKSGNHISPFDTAVNAATNIQAAVNVATNNSTIEILDNARYSNFAVTARTNFLIHAVNDPPFIRYGTLYNRILLRNCRNLKMSNILLAKADRDGLKMINLTGCTLKSIISRTNGNSGIFLTNCYNSLITCSTAGNNFHSGIKIIHSTNISVNESMANNNNNNGIQAGDYSVADDSKDIHVYYSTCKKNSYPGIWFKVKNGDISCNISYSNTDHGIAFYKASNISIYSNTVFKNSTGGAFWKGNGIYLEASVLCQVFGNHCYSNDHCGIKAYTSNNNYFRYNTADKNSESGIKIDQSQNCFLIRNYTYNNSTNGITFTGTCNYLTAESNKVFNNSQEGISCKTADNSVLIRNLFYYNRSGIIMDNCDNSLIKNNVIYSNSRNGMLFQNSSINNNFRNNIVVYNNIPDKGAYYGLVKDITSSVSNTYNDIYGNKTSLTNSSTGDGLGNYQGLSSGTGSFSPSKNPCFLSTDSLSSNFLHLSNISPCLEAGSPEDNSDPVKKGLNIDMGAFEFLITASFLNIKKEITQVVINSNVSDVIPGSSLIYSISASNTGPGEGIKVVIYDKLSEYLAYKTNSDNTLSGWTAEWSTNDNPLLDYNSHDFTQAEPAAGKIKWVRWTSPVVDINTTHTFSYAVILK